MADVNRMAGVSGRGDREEEESIDSVGEAYKGEYSDETLDLLRRFEKPEWMDEPSSLDPLEDMEEHVAHHFRMPPATYDAAQAAAAEVLKELVASKDKRLDHEDEQIAQYRKLLAEGTSLDEIKLLKLRAYHRAMDERRAQMAEARRQLMEEVKVPLDRDPQELVKMMPEKLPDRGHQAQHASQGLSQQQWESASEESVWHQDWDRAGYLGSEASKWDFNAALGLRQQAAAAEEPSPDPLEEFGQLLPYGDPAKYKVWEPVHGYTPSYLEQLQLEKRIRAQARQRSLAFWLPLSAVMGTYVLKSIRRLVLRRGGGKAGGKQRKVVA